MIVLHRLVAYSNHELSLEIKIWKMIPYELMVEGRNCFFDADSYLYFVVLSYINVSSIEGSSHLIFYKIRQACDLFFFFVNFGHPNSFNSFSFMVILNAPVHNKLAFLCSLSSCSLSYMVQES